MAATASLPIPILMSDRSAVKPILLSVLVASGLIASGLVVSGLASPGIASAQTANPSGPSAPTGEWRGGAVTGEGGAFAYCVTENLYDNGLALVFARNAAGETNIAIGIPGATLPQGQQYRMRLAIDESLVRDVQGVAAEGDLLVVAMGRDDAFYEASRKGARLTVEGPTDSAVFRLTGTSKALADLRDCVAREGVTSGGGGGTGQPFPDALVAILDAAGLDEARPLVLDTVPRENRPADFAWRLGPVFGGVLERSVPAGSDFSTLASAYVDALRARCQGEWSADLGTGEVFADVTIGTGKVGCVGPENTIHVALLVYLTDTNIFTVFFHEAAREDGALADQARDALATVIRQLARKPS